MKSILLSVDIFHDTGWEASLEHAVSLANLYGAALHVLSVIPDFGMPMVASYFPKDFSKNAISEAEAKLTGFVRDHIPDEVAVTQHVKHGSIYKEILTVADALKVDMIVLASHRPEMRDYLLGPNAARVVRHAKQSVCVIR
jgi:nucleotide-binding universal stress UspA family protein